MNRSRSSDGNRPTGNPQDQRERNTGKKKNPATVKMLVTLIAVGLALLALTVRIYRIQKNNAEEYNQKVLEQRQSKYDSKYLIARRGDIYDRNGNRLATSEKVYTLILDPEQMIARENRKNNGTKSRNVIETTLKAVAEQFDLDYAELSELVNNNPSSSYLRVKKNISYEEKQSFLEYQDSENTLYLKSEDAETKKKEIFGLWFEDAYKRVYPYGSLACSVIGFSNADGNAGTGGVEQYYNEILTGTPGREYGYLDDDADLESVVKSAQNGSTLVLTIDEGIQAVVEKYLKEWDEGEPGSDTAACIVMNPKNGEILAMASTNTFDLNSPITTGSFTEDEIYSFGLTAAAADYRKNHPDEAITEEDVPNLFTGEQILNYGKTNASYRIWRNICVSDTYEPGSTQKIFTVAGAMEEGIITSSDTYNCEGHVELSDGVNTWRINCVNRSGHGILDVTGGITNSCNVVMMNIAFEEGSETFMKYERIFGFGEYTGIDLPAEADTENLGFSTDKIGRTQLATNSFGQNYNCTMVQMAAAYASVANGGYYYQPHVVKRILTADGALETEVEPKLVRETVSKSTCDYLKSALFETVETGTGKAAKVEGYTIGGKTGTAQKLPRSAETYLVSFCGFAPADDPQLLCYVIVDEPHLPGQEAAHSSFASGIFAKIMEEALPSVGVYPEGTLASEYVAPFAQNKTEQETQIPSSEEKETEKSEEEQGNRKEKGNTSETEPQTEKPIEHQPATDEYISGEDNGGELPEIIFGQAPG